MAHQGYDLQLTRYDERGWRATFYTTGMEHSPTSARAPGGSARPGTRRNGRRGWDLMDDVTPVLGAVQRSGFPLQARIQHEIQRRPAWSVLASEHPWIDPDGREQFVDLIACCSGRRAVALVIECKKMQQRSLLFLRRIGQDNTEEVATISVWRRKDKDEPWSPELLVGDYLEPRSYVSQFCVPTDKDRAGQRLLEPDARVVALAAETLARQDWDRRFPKGCLLVPVIATTARLYTLSFRPDEVSLDTGEFSDPLHHERIMPIPWVRFEKTLTARNEGGWQTVFVVSSASLPAFLDEVARRRGDAVSARTSPDAP